MDEPKTDLNLASEVGIKRKKEARKPHPDTSSPTYPPSSTAKYTTRIPPKPPPSSFKPKEIDHRSQLEKLMGKVLLNSPLTWVPNNRVKTIEYDLGPYPNPPKPPPSNIYSSPLQEPYISSSFSTLPCLDWVRKSGLSWLNVLDPCLLTLAESGKKWGTFNIGSLISHKLLHRT